ncbi:ribonucleotide reductase class II [Synechococcus T7-like phage S-TIP37]|uniref:Ribonucleotide reductase class II n=1 Tax=Synechococcus T7-like phage S-TIP37 TaxID=1332145 RepID=A0A345AYA1_9CAUD|nr:ribonucleotide reductase [Synechococcus T7-like phage S-TIP37]AXF42081.1 ribonucleotide reductase class II [Synechococcus T7-like phage S-TIP37]
MTTASYISRTGRVQSWLDDPTSRLPVSCTVFVVEDSITGDNGIEASWKFVSHALRYGAGCAVHLSKLRPKGTENDKGLVASGPVSFAKIYSTLNEILRRGGVYKNGAVVCHLDLSHPDALEFIKAPRQELPWVKRCINITPEWWEGCPFKEDLLYGIKSGDIWLNKVKYDNEGNRIRGNVCLEVYLPSRGTCLLQHINLSACEYGDIERAFTEGMSQLCSLHAQTGVGDSGEYLPPETDRQVGLGMLGLAGLLRRYEVTYEQFGIALDDFNAGRVVRTPAFELVSAIAAGIDAAAEIARNNNMVRAFAIAPTASCSYRSKDLDGFTATPEIAPPISRTVDRDSGTFGVETYNYGDVEIASEVGWENYKRVADGIMTLLSRTGLLHGYSFNSWSDVVTYDNAFIEEWLAGPQTSLYYSLQVMGDVQDKSSAYAALEETEVEDYLASLINGEDQTNDLQCDCQE